MSIKEPNNDSPTKTVLRDSKGRIVKGSILNPHGLQGNKTNGHEIKQKFFDAFIELGGMVRLKQWVTEDKANEKEFYKMIISSLPKDINNNIQKDVQILIIQKDTTKGILLGESDNSRTIPIRVSQQ